MVKLAFKPHLTVWLQYKRAVRIISVRLLGMRASLVEKQLSTQFEVPCTLEYFSSYWGIENIQLYLWILKVRVEYSTLLMDVEGVCRTSSRVATPCCT
jgi:hypothetical protein